MCVCRAGYGSHSVCVLNSTVSFTGVGNLSSAKGRLDIYNIIEGHIVISLKISLLSLVKHLINSPLMPGQDQTK